jgi:small subunit ribosomal protein S2
MKEIKIEDLKEAKIYFGHRTFRWNPKTKPYIFKKQFGIYFIDLEKTKTYLEEAMKIAHKLGREGKKILWVGTKKQAAPIVREWAEKTDCKYINRRWLAGILTNFKTISSRLDEMDKLEKIVNSNTLKESVHTKKERLIMSRKLEKLKKNLLGLKGMKSVPDVVFVIDIGKESLAVSAVGEAYIEGLESFKKKTEDGNAAEGIEESSAAQTELSAENAEKAVPIKESDTIIEESKEEK